MSRVWEFLWELVRHGYGKWNPIRHGYGSPGNRRPEAKRTTLRSPLSQIPDATQKFALYHHISVESAESELTFDEDGREAALLDRGVGHKLDVHLVGGGLDVGRHSMSAVVAEQSGTVLVPVAHFDEVVHAVVVVFHLKNNADDDEWLAQIGRVTMTTESIVVVVVVAGCWLLGGGWPISRLPRAEAFSSPSAQPVTTQTVCACVCRPISAESIVHWRIQRGGWPSHLMAQNFFFKKPPIPV